MDNEDLDLEFRRNLFHLFLGIFIAIFVLFAGSSISVVFFSILLLICLLFSDLLQEHGVPGLNFIIDKFERRDQIPGEGVITFFVGALIVTSIFPSNIAFISILLVSVIDSFTVLVGRKYGWITICEDKNLTGTFAGFLVGFLFIYPFLEPLHALIVAFAGSVSELFCPYDNIAIQVVTAVILAILII